MHTTIHQWVASRFAAIIQDHLTQLGTHEAELVDLCKKIIHMGGSDLDYLYERSADGQESGPDSCADMSSPRTNERYALRPTPSKPLSFSAGDSMREFTTYGTVCPDVAFYYDDFSMPRLVMEVAYSQTSSSLEDRAEKFLIGFGGQINTLVTVNLDYPDLHDFTLMVYRYEESVKEGKMSPAYKVDTSMTLPPSSEGGIAGEFTLQLADFVPRSQHSTMSSNPLIAIPTALLTDVFIHGRKPFLRAKSDAMRRGPPKRRSTFRA